MVNTKLNKKIAFQTPGNIQQPGEINTKFFSGVKRGRLENVTHKPLFSLTDEDVQNFDEFYNSVKHAGYPLTEPKPELAETFFSMSCQAYDSFLNELGYEFLDIAANLGLIEAVVMRAHMKKNGEGTKKNFNAAWKDFLLCAEMGNTNAQATVAYHYLVGEDGIEKDLEKSKFWMEKAADNGCDAAIDMLRDWDIMIKRI